jgi:hypothetical protein
MARSVTQAHRLVLVSTSRADVRSGLKERAARRAQRGVASVIRVTKNGDGGARPNLAR